MRVLLMALVLGCAPGMGGIHARMGYSEESGLRVVDVPEDGGGYRGGLREGDRISSIDDIPVRSMGMQEVVEKLRGPSGSNVTLRIVRDGELMTLEIERTPYSR